MAVDYNGGSAISASNTDQNTMNVNGSNQLYVVVKAPITSTSGVSLQASLINFNVWSIDSTVGCAPNLSANYAEFDSGSSVFTDLYVNFKGTGTPTGWTKSFAGTWTLNNGINITNDPTHTNYLLTTATYSSGTTYTMGILGDIAGTNTVGDGWDLIGYQGTSSVTDNNQGVGVISLNSLSSNTYYAYTQDSGGVAANATLSTSFSTTVHAFNISFISSSSCNFYVDYGGAVALTTHLPTSALPLGIYGTQTNTGTIYAIYLRKQAPSDVLPTRTYANLTTSLTRTKYGYGYSVNITLTNNQVGATVSGFQALIDFNANTYKNLLNVDLSNVFFTSDSAGQTVLASWLETGTSSSNPANFWVNLSTNTIAGSGGTLTIYLWIL